MNILIVRVTCRGDVEIWWKLDMAFTIFNIFFAFSGVPIADSCKMVPSRNSVTFFFSGFKHKVLQSWQRVVINAIWNMLFNVLFSVQRQISVFGNLFGTSSRCFSALCLILLTFIPVTKKYFKELACLFKSVCFPRRSSVDRTDAIYKES